MSGELRVQRVVSADDRARAFEIRRVVFVGEQNVPEEMELDEHDDAPPSETSHVLAWIDDRAVGTGRLIAYEGDSVGKIGRMAVLEEARGRGAGTKIIEALTEIARERGFSELILDAQVQALRFYQRLGYVAEGVEFLDAGLAHRRMRRRV